MLRQRTLRTYGRNKAGQASSSGNQTSIIREDIPKEKELQPTEFLAFKDSDQSLEYDPFETTFDRLVRDTKAQSVVPVQADDSFVDSSSDEEVAVKMPPPSPLINPRPVRQRRGYKKLKPNPKTESIKLFKNSSSVDENTEPNIEPPQSRMRGKNKRNPVEPKNVVKKKRRVADKSEPSTSGGKRLKNPILSGKLTNCSVILTRIMAPLDKSMAALTLENDVVDADRIPEKSDVQDTSGGKPQTESPENLNIEPVEKTKETVFKNPIVSLNRLKVSQVRPSVANKSWLSSTPIDRRIIRPKSTLRLSPIGNDMSMEITERDENDNDDEQKLLQSKHLTPKISKITKPSNLMGQLTKNLRKSSLRVLSDSTDPEQSSLLFDDTEIQPPLADSYRPLVETGNSEAVDESTISPLKGFVEETPVTSPSTKKSRHAFRAVSAPIANPSNATETSSASPFKGFTKESTDSGSLHLTFSGSDNTADSTKEFTRSVEKLPPDSHASSVSEEEPMDVTDAASLKESTEDENDKSGESVENPQTVAEESAKNPNNISQESIEDLENISKKSDQDTQNISQENVEDLKNITQESVEDLKNDSQESVEDLKNITQESVENLKNITQESAEDLKNITRESVGDLKNITQESVKDLENDSQESVKDRKNITQESVEDLKNDSQESVEDSQNLSQETTKDISVIPDESAEVARIILKRRAKAVPSSLKESAINLSNSDDEWATMSVCPSSDASSTEIPENATIDSTKGESIVQVSSDDSESAGDIGEFVNASENPSELKDDSREPSSFETAETSSVNEATQSKDQKSSIAEMTRKENWPQVLNRRSKQPVVLLSRLSVPIKRSSRISNVKNTRSQSPTITRKSSRTSSSKNDNTNANKSANVRQSVPELMEFQDSDNEESQESQDDMESLKMDDVSGNTPEAGESTIMEVSKKDSKKGSFRWSMTEVKTPSDISSKKRDENDTRNSKTSVEFSEASIEISEAGKMSPKILKEHVEPDKVIVRKSRVEEKSMKEVAKVAPDDNRRSIQPIVLLSPLKDSTRITERRKKYRNWGLSAITENVVTSNVPTIEEEPDELETADQTKDESKKEETVEKELQPQSSRDECMKTSQSTTASCDVSVLASEEHDSVREDRVVFLKPGKSWSRSLSIYRQVHSQEDLELLAINKGKKWRQSVQGVLDMQQQGVIQSCVKKNEDDKESRSSYRIRDTAAAAWTPGSSQPDTSRVFSQSSVGSPGRFVRRVSIRVVPDRKNSELYEDSPFLEAYGITSSENRKTLGKRSTLIAPRASTLHVYNVHCADVTFDSIPKSLNSVTSRDVVLAQCGQESSVAFEECYPDLYLKQCRKIGEGVFGEVFLYEKGAAKSVIKIIPIEGELKVNGERQKKFDEILSEIVIAKELNNLRFAGTSKTSSFVEVKNIRCVVGKYPPKLIDLWNTYDEEKNSENDCPDMFDKNQLYIVLELGHGGTDLEAFVFQNSSETHALFIQTALALAVAEESLEFEHRDLHWGNVLISRTDDSQITYKLRDKDISVASKGVKVSVIDFTLSRMSYQGCSIFNDLSLDDDLFAAQGEYQFEIYRLMRQKVQNNWQTFEPFTNVLWLHYTLDKMITAARYRRTSSKIHKSGIKKLQDLKAEILNYKSAFDFVTNCDKVTRLQGSRSSTSTAETSD